MNILSIEGGGVLGLSQVLTLEALEQTNKQQCHQMFDLIAGTSVGCIEAACLSIGLPATNIKSFFTVDAPNIFKTHWYSNIAALFNPKYSSNILETSLQSILGKSTLKDCKTKFLGTSYDFATDRAVYFKSYELSSSTNDYIIIGYDSPIQLWQICRSSSAAQTYFPAFVYDNMTLLDGGNASVNVPDILAICEVLNEYELKDIQMLSLGNGNTVWDEKASSMVSPSLITAGLKTVTLLFTAGEDSCVYEASRLLKNNYYRLNPDLGKGIAIDDANSAITLIPPAIQPVILKAIPKVFPQFKVSPV